MPQQGHHHTRNAADRRGYSTGSASLSTTVAGMSIRMLAFRPCHGVVRRARLSRLESGGATRALRLLARLAGGVLSGRSYPPVVTVAIRLLTSVPALPRFSFVSKGY